MNVNVRLHALWMMGMNGVSTAQSTKEAAAAPARILNFAAGERLLITSIPVQAPNSTVMPLPRKLMVAQLPAWLRLKTALSTTTPILSMAENGPAEPGKAR